MIGELFIYMDTQKDLNFLFELGTLRYVDRTWRQFLGADFANTAEHTFRVMWIALYLAKREGGDLNKIVPMALMHDITETRTGDVQYMSRLYTKRDEKKAIDDMTNGLLLEDEVKVLWEEYEKRESLEARIVKDADTLDVDMELVEQSFNGNKLLETFKPQREQVGSLLFTESAKALWKEIYNSNPHDWHRTGTNRFTQGDWKPTK